MFESFVLMRLTTNRQTILKFELDNKINDKHNISSSFDLLISFSLHQVPATTIIQIKIEFPLIN